MRVVKFGDSGTEVKCAITDFGPPARHNSIIPDRKVIALLFPSRPHASRLVRFFLETHASRCRSKDNIITSATRHAEVKNEFLVSIKSSKKIGEVQCLFIVHKIEFNK